MGRAPLWFAVALAFVAACGEPSESVSLEEGSGSGSGLVEIPCWTATAGPICPAQPRGRVEADCPAGLLAGSGFAAGTGLCAPAFAEVDCPQEWERSAREGVTFCAPPPTPTCAPGELALPGRCLPIGEPCAPGADWPDEATLRARAPGYEGPIIYVRPDGDLAGDGSRTNPTTLTTATMRRAEGGILALSRGRHSAALRVDRSLALLGACAAETVVEAATPSDTLGTMELAANGPVTVRDITITGARPGLVIRGSGAEAHRVASVLIDRATGYGIKAESPQLTALSQVGIVDTQPFGDGSFGIGLSASSGAIVAGERVELRANRTLGLLVTGAGSQLSLEGSRVGETLPQESNRRFGRGVNVGAGGRFDAAATLVEGNSSTGLFAIDPQSAIYGIQLVVRGTLADARTGDFGRGIEVDTEAILDCEGCVLTGNLDAGLVVDDGGIATLRQTVIADNRPRTSDGRYGRGIMVQGGGRLDASGLLIAGHTDLALYLSDPVTEAALTDLVVAGPAAAVDRLVSIQAEAAADLQRARIVGDALLGIYVGTGASVTANDLQLEGRGAAELAETARLLEVSRGGALTGLRVALFPTQGGGALVTEPSASLVLRDALLRSPHTGRPGRGVEVNLGGRATLERALVEGFDEAGVAAFFAPTSLVLRDAVVASVAGLPGATRGSGHALGIYDGAELTATELVVREAAQVGLRLAGADTRFDVAGAALVDCFVGANLEIPGLSSEQLSALFRDEFYAGNGQDIGLQTFDLPEPTTSLEPAN